MNFDGGASVRAGLIAGAVMSGFLYMGIGMMLRQMKMNLFLMLPRFGIETGPWRTWREP